MFVTIIYFPSLCGPHIVHLSSWPSLGTMDFFVCTTIAKGHTTTLFGGYGDINEVAYSIYIGKKCTNVLFPAGP